MNMFARKTTNGAQKFPIHQIAEMPSYVQLFILVPTGTVTFGLSLLNLSRNYMSDSEAKSLFSKPSAFS